jgi:glutamate synthase (NADPH/NADH) large chain
VASLIARLERGEDVFGRFTKLVPVDFQAVLALRERFEEDGTDPDGSEAWSSILEMTHG